jgi:hypothetical protein
MTNPRLYSDGRARRVLLLPVLTAVLVISAAAAPARGQLANLDTGMLIDALASEGMSDLLLHLIETEPPADPTVAALIQVAQYRLQYAEADTFELRLEAYTNALERKRRLIRDHDDHEQRPIWQTDLAEMLLTEYLGSLYRNAPLFVEFGVPVEDQRRAFESAVVEALEATSQANLRFFQLQTTLPREADHAERRERTGLWRRMMDDYYRKRTPFYLAMASHFVTLLPDDHAYFTQPNDRVPNKQPTAEREKMRLFEQVQSSLEPFIGDVSDAAGIRTAALAIEGRARLVRNQPDEAMERLEPVVAARTGDLYDFSARLAVAKASALRGQFGEAVDRLADALDHRLARDFPLFRLLAIDLEHRVVLMEGETAPANRRAAAVAAAYEPYLRFLDDPQLGPHAVGLRNYVYTRWADRLDPSTSISDLPPMVRMAIGEIERIQGQNLVIESQQSGDPEPAQRARQHLQRSIELSQSAKADAATDAVRARAAFNLGMAQYFTGPQDLATILRATSTFKELAESLPDQPQAEEAITYAVQLLRSLHALAQRPPGVDEAYRRAADVLFSNFGTSAAADDERLYYGFFVLERSGQHREAAEILSRTPPLHPNYFENQREALFSLESAMNAATTNDDRAELRRQMLNQALAIEADSELSTGDDVDAAKGAIRLVRWTAAMDEGETEKALAYLAGFEEEFATHHELVRLALERRIIALAQAQRMDELTSAANAMMGTYPDEAAGVIGEVLDRLDDRIDSLRAEASTEQIQLRRTELENEATRLASTASMLAGLLVNWAAGQGFTAEDMLPYELVRAKSLVLAGRASDAVEVTQRLITAFPNDAAVISQHADALFGQGDQQSLAQAARYYDQIIRGIQQAPFPSVWWNAWLRRLQINDRLNQGTADIPLRVRQLRLEDPNLGGPRYRAGLEALAEKYQR